MYKERIISIERAGIEKTFDLQVSGNPNFLLANGILTHNSGKSYQAMYCVDKFLSFSGKTLPLEHCVFTLADLFDVIEKGDKGDVFILDEQSATAAGGSRIEASQLKNLESTVRQHKLSLFFLSPEYIKHVAHFTLETWTKGAIKPWDFSKPIEPQWKYTKSILWNNKEYILGYVITGTPANSKFLAEYEKKKSKYIDDVRSMKTSGRQMTLAKIVDALVKDTKFMDDLYYSETKTRKKYLLIKKLEGRMLSMDEIKMILDEIVYGHLENYRPKK